MRELLLSVIISQLMFEIRADINDFAVYWNVPSFTCQKYGINFYNLTTKYNILSNPNDTFRGKKINILYDPGAYPALLTQGDKKLTRNGGIPQLGNITYHLDLLTETVDQLVPKYYSGPLVLDEETWKPIWRQNWNAQQAYRDMSTSNVRGRYPNWSNDRVTAQAKKEFEAGARVFFETSADLVQAMRPNALVGYYGYPYCYNMRSDNDMSSACSKQVQQENNRIQWLYDASAAFYPSIYLSCLLKTFEQVKFVRGRMDEAKRLSNRVSSSDPPNVYPYLWYKYYDKPDFVSKEDLTAAIDTVMKYNLGGLIIWGASNDFASLEKCQQVQDYLTNVLGPVLQSLKERYSWIYKNPIDMSQLRQVSSPKAIFTAVDVNGTKSIFQYEDADGKITYHGDSYVYNLEPEDGNNDNNSNVPTPPSRTARSTTSSTPRLNKVIAKWYERVLRSMIL